MMKHKHIISNLTKTLLSLDYKGTVIYAVLVSRELIELTIHLPHHKELTDLQSILPNLQQELNATDHKVVNHQGKRITIQFAKSNLDDITYTNSHLNPNTLKVSLISSFGPLSIDFADGASCHLLTGGATRMGKTTFQLYLTTMLYIQTNGHLDMHIATTKANDFYPFKNVDHVEIVKTEAALQILLDKIIQEYKRRDNILDTLSNATDAKSVKLLYPDKYHLFRPIFLIIDEYSRFSSNNEIKKKTEELVETAGYLNVHVIISTTRPDARTVLTPRIKANLNCRVCFHTVDVNNSVVILDEEGAESLPNIQGRAILRDGEKHIIQVPYLSYPECVNLLKPYERIEQNDTSTKTIQSNARQTNTELSNKIQNMFTQSTSLPGIQSEHQPNQRMQSNHEKTILKWSMPSSPSIKR